MNLLRKTIFALLLACTFQVNAQENYILRHVKVYEATDSIIQDLYSKGIDTLISMHRVWQWEKQKNFACEEETYSSFILWYDNNIFHYQVINEFAIFKPKKEYRKNGLLAYLFKYYFLNAEDIESNRIETRYLIGSDEGKSIEELVYGGGDFNVLKYKFGNSENQMYWYTPNLRFDDSGLDYKIFDSKSFIWATLIEREFRKTINTYWNPIEVNVPSIKKTIDFFEGFTLELDKKRKEAEFLKRSHAYERQEILIPHKLSGLITIVQGLTCGEKIEIVDSIRTIPVPRSRNLILDSPYISYYHEYSKPLNIQKTIAFQTNGKKRHALQLLDENSGPDDFGLSVIGQFNESINSKKYDIIVMFVGLKKEAEAVYDQQKFYNERLPQLLKECE